MSHLFQLQKKIVSLNNLVQEISALKSQNKKIVFTNGCFDILHKGHVQYLSLAADLGDVLVVGLNSDASVKRQGKGDDRPVNNSDARALILAGLGFVNFVVEFDDDTPLNLIEAIVPDVLVKGGDYDPLETNADSKKYIVGRDVVLKNNGRVEVIDLVQGFSTTSIIQKLKK
ncbi:MAG: D-glycero-beta-D-manno-heptose 1-phosphate adenylyltransferase [Crocinitomicaceae bacterium]|nr:D-glycero-beta-D-manno-heptose 1-phosphate adenylyltransferase [Crocinitomicaceae bacterium]MBK9590573.1 D-glycero-beta-D-manno-heptose 1-phosphate adenylyltransferase [Crocinitomicaceae bacterium]